MSKKKRKKLKKIIAKAGIAIGAVSTITALIKAITKLIDTLAKIFGG